MQPATGKVGVGSSERGIVVNTGIVFVIGVAIILVICRFLYDTHSPEEPHPLSPLPSSPASR